MHFTVRSRFLVYRDSLATEGHHEGHEEHEGSVDISLDAVFQFGRVEVHQQAGLDVCQFHVRQ